MPKVSIIVPVYKVEKYLKKCIDSILMQSFTDFELILVDDGSPDACGKICDEYAEKDERVNVIHKENGGICSARNAGIEIAKGDYIGFIDSDDWIEPDMYDFLYSNINKYDADIAICGVNRVYENSNKTIKKSKHYSNTIIDQKAAFSILFSKKDTINVFAWNKLYRKEIFEEIRYPEGQLYEDIYMISEIMLQATKIFITNMPLYNYLQRNGSITGNNDVALRVIRKEAVERNYELFAANYPEYIDNIEGALYAAKYYILDKMILSKSTKDEEFRKVVRELRHVSITVMRNKSVTFRRRLSAACLMISLKLYKLCVLFQYGK